MPRPITPVKSKVKALESYGAVDLHFHGAFGIDLMTASHSQLDELSAKLWKKGIAAFCPTTLSSSRNDLQQAVENLGRWIRSKNHPGAIPLGIHLEGPFLNSDASGAHPVPLLRKLEMAELDRLWNASQETLKLITLAPESLSLAQLKKLTAWSKARKITLAIGHSQATQAQAQQALDAGFSGVTHAWNALPFHHRAPGVLGAALGRSKTHVEIILDQIHVDPVLVRWTQKLHPNGLCFVSDCAPAAATSGSSWHSFGPLQVRFHQGACRVRSGTLAGGGKILTDAFSEWVQTEAQADGRNLQQTLLMNLPHLTEYPLKALGIPISRLKNRKICWISTDDFQSFHAQPLTKLQLT